MVDDLWKDVFPSNNYERNMEHVLDILVEYSKVVSLKLGKFTCALYGSMRGGTIMFVIWFYKF